MSEATQNPRVSFHAMAHGGEAVGTLPDGRAVFVAGVLPGESALVQLVHQKKNWARGEVVELLERSEDRVDPPCPHFGRCGGCQWQHVALDRQRELKREIVVGQLQHLGRIDEPPVEATRAVGPADGFGYRNHVRLALDDQGRAGYFRPRSKQVEPIDRCPLLHPLLGEWLEAMPPLPGGDRLELRAGTRTGQRLAMVQGQVHPEAAAQARQAGVPLTRAGKGEITEMVHSEHLRVSSKSFFQVNTEAAELLVDLVVEMLEPGADDSILDAFAGVGLFAVPLARRTSRVYAVERNAAAVRDLRHHAEDLKTRLHVVGTSIEQAFAQLPDRVDLVVADPPREGLGEEIAQALARLKPRRLVLVSCDPAAGARDARTLVESGYRLARVVPVDQFPHTYHVETLLEFHA